MERFSERELHNLVDGALSIDAPRQLTHPSLSYLDFPLLEITYEAMEKWGVDEKIRNEVLTTVKEYISGAQTKLNLQSLRNSITNCVKCVETTGKPRNVLGNSINPKILFILSNNENDLNLLARLVEEEQFEKLDCCFTYAVRCPVANNISETTVNNCSNYLFSEIDYMRPSICVPVGALPLKILCGNSYTIIDQRGRMFWYGINRIFPIFTPTYADKASKTDTLKNDLKTLKQATYA